MTAKEAEARMREMFPRNTFSVSVTRFSSTFDGVNYTETQRTIYLTLDDGKVHDFQGPTWDRCIALARDFASVRVITTGLN